MDLQILEHRPADEVLEANRPCGAHGGLGRDVGGQDRRHARDSETATDIQGGHDGEAEGDIRDLDSDPAGIGETGNSWHRRNGHAGETGQSAAADFDRVEIVSECVDLEGAKDAGIGLGPLDLSAEPEGQRAAQLEEAVHLKDRLAHFRRDDLHGFGGIEEDKRAAGRGETVAAGRGKGLGEIDRGQRGGDLVPEETKPAIAGDHDILEGGGDRFAKADKLRAGEREFQRIENMLCIEEHGISELNVPRVEADRIGTKGCSIVGRTAGLAGISHKDIHPGGGEREDEEPPGQCCGVEPLDHQSVRVLADPERVVAADMQESVDIQNGSGHLDNPGFRAERAIQPDGDALAIAPESATLAADPHRESGWNFERLFLEVDHASGEVRGVETHGDGLRSDHDTVEADKADAGCRGIDRHPDRSGGGPKCQDRREIHAVEFQSTALTVRNTAREKVLVDGGEGDGGDLFTRVGFRDGIVDFEGVQFDLDVDCLAELHEALDIDIELSGEGEEAASTRAEAVGAQAEGEVFVVADRHGRVDRGAIVREVEVTHPHIGGGELHAVETGEAEPGDRGVEKRPLAGREAIRGSPLAEEPEGEVGVLDFDSLANAAATGADKRAGVLDSEHERVDIHAGAADESDFAAGRFEREPSVDLGDSQQVGRDITAGGECRPRHVERDRCRRGRVAEQNRQESDRGLGPIHGTSVAAEHRGRIEDQRRAGDIRREPVDADKSGPFRAGFGRHPNPVCVELCGDGKAKGRPLEREAGASVRAAADSEEKIRQRPGEGKHRRIDLRAVVEGERGIIRTHPHAEGFIHEALDLQSRLALKVEEDLAADTDVECRIADRGFDVVTDRECGVETSGVGGQQDFGRTIGETDVAAHPKHPEETGVQSLDVKSHGARADRTGEGIARRTDPQDFAGGDGCGGRGVLNEYAVSFGDRHVCDRGGEVCSVEFERELVAAGSESEATGDGDARKVSGGEGGADVVADRDHGIVRQSESEVARHRDKVPDRGLEARHRKGISA